MCGYESCDAMFHRRAVVGYGIDEEDQIDQWTEDAESVSVCLCLCVCMSIRVCVCVC